MPGSLRAVEPRRARRHRVLARASAGAVRPRGSDRRATGCRRPAPPCSSSTGTRATRSSRCRVHARRARRLGRGERLRFASGAPRISSASTTSSSAARSAPRAPPYVVKAHGSELEYSMRGSSRLSAWAEVLAGAAATVVESEHIPHRLRPRGLRDGGSRPRDPTPASTWSWQPAPRAEALAGSSPSHSSMRRTSRTPTSDFRTRTRCA